MNYNYFFYDKDYPDGALRSVLIHKNNKYYYIEDLTEAWLITDVFPITLEVLINYFLLETKYKIKHHKKYLKEILEDIIANEI